MKKTLTIFLYFFVLICNINGMNRAMSLIRPYNFGMIQKFNTQSGIYQKTNTTIAPILFNIYREKPHFNKADSAYKILGIDHNASEQAIKKAYRSLSLKYHPDIAQYDKNYTKTDANEDMRLINNAYEYAISRIQTINNSYSAENKSSEKKTAQENNNYSKKEYKNESKFEEKENASSEKQEYYSEEQNTDETTGDFFIRCLKAYSVGIIIAIPCTLILKSLFKTIFIYDITPEVQKAYSKINEELSPSEAKEIAKDIFNAIPNNINKNYRDQKDKWIIQSYIDKILKQKTSIILENRKKTALAQLEFDKSFIKAIINADKPTTIMPRIEDLCKKDKKNPNFAREIRLLKMNLVLDQIKKISQKINELDQLPNKIKERSVGLINEYQHKLTMEKNILIDCYKNAQSEYQKLYC